MAVRNAVILSLSFVAAVSLLIITGASGGLCAGKGKKVVESDGNDLFFKGRALLIGCKKYPGYYRTVNGKKEPLQLNGPPNDVRLIKSLLEEKFNFDPNRITALSGWPRNKKRRPTRANIEREFQRLASVAEPGEQVVIFYAGHGSQQPANDDPLDQEPDNFDEILVPSDTIKWDDEKRSLTNVIVDDEIREWLRAIRSKGAFVWIIVDSCHSGTMTRGAPVHVMKFRYIPPSDLIPREEWVAAKQRTHVKAKTRGGLDVHEEGLDLELGGIVAMYAAQAGLLTPEGTFPPNSGTCHGLYTYTFAKIILQAESSLTYRELAARISASYGYPHPFIEGMPRDVDKEILGLRHWPERPRMLLGVKSEGGRLSLRAGHLHGILPGSILEVFPPAGKKGADNPIGHVKVISAAPLGSIVEPVAYGDLPSPRAEKLVPGCRCRTVFMDFGDMRLKVALQTVDRERVLPSEQDANITTHGSGKGPDKLEGILKEAIGKKENLVERVDNEAEADWFVRQIEDNVYLVPSSGWALSRPEGDKARESSSSIPPKYITTNLVKDLRKIARARNLLSISTQCSSKKSADGIVGIEVEPRLLSRSDDPVGEPIRFGPTGRTLRAGDIVGFKIKNKSRFPVDVTLLYIEDGYGITPIFPYSGISNRLNGGETLPPNYTSCAVKADVIERGQLVAIAVRAKPGEQRQDFSFLAQSKLERVTTRGPGEQLAAETPLGRLLESAMDGLNETRGLDPSELDSSYSLQHLSWTIVPDD